MLRLFFDSAPSSPIMSPLRRAAESDAMNGGRGRWQHLRSVGASEDDLFAAVAVNLVHLAYQAEAVDGPSLKGSMPSQPGNQDCSVCGLRSRIGNWQTRWRWPGGRRQVWTWRGAPEF